MASSESNPELEAAVLAFLANTPTGTLHSKVMEHFNTTQQHPKAAVHAAMHQLRNNSRISVKLTEDRRDYIVAPMRKASLNERHSLIVEVIAGSGSTGLDAGTIAALTKLPRVEVTKALQHLVQRGVVQDVKGVANRSLKLYLLAEVEPSVEITGGTFYNSSRELDQQYIEQLRSTARECIARNKTASVSQIKELFDTTASDAGRPARVVGDAGVESRRKALSLAEVGTIMRALQLDDVVELVPPSQYDVHPGISVDDIGNMRYKLSSTNGLSNGMMTFPCGSCPQVAECDPTGRGTVNPVNCRYLTEWTEMF